MNIRIETLMKHFFYLGIFLFFLPQLSAQNDEIKNYDHVYRDNIKSVKFHIDGLYLSYPIVELNSNNQLILSFDDLDADNKNYVYSFIHCDRDWQPSQLTEMEYLDGFSEEQINNYRFSFKTIKTYTHYEVLLPNNYVKWTKSGNYLLVVYDNTNQKTPVITRRFMVVDSRVRITPQMVRPAKVSKTKTHQEIDFAVDHEKFPLRNPRQEIKAFVLQNGRWDNAIQEIEPLFLRTNRMLFDYQDRIVFPGGKEFRSLDMRSLRYVSQNISSIERKEDIFEVTVYKDRKTAGQSYLSRPDLNGNFVIESLDESNFDLSGDYANVLFALYSPQPLYEKEVYVVGNFTDWEMKTTNKMVYNNVINAYVAKIPIKQGFYDYAYGVRPANDPSVFSPNLSEIQGNWHETENQYTILIYYRPFGERYDQLVGATTFKSFN